MSKLTIKKNNDVKYDGIITNEILQGIFQCKLCIEKGFTEFFVSMTQYSLMDNNLMYYSFDKDPMFKSTR